MYIYIILYNIHILYILYIYIKLLYISYIIYITSIKGNRQTGSKRNKPQRKQGNMYVNNVLNMNVLKLLSIEMCASDIYICQQVQENRIK